MNKRKTLVVVMGVAVALALIIYFTYPREQVTVEFIQSFSDKLMFERNATQYDFSISVSRQTTWTTPFGTTREQMLKALQPLVSKYDLVSVVEDGITRPAFESVFIQIGKSTFSLYSYNPLTSEQINSITVDLREAITSAPTY
jgi:hypothetical protein